VRGQFIFRWTHKELVCKQGVPGILGNDADGHPVGGIRTAEEVLDKKLTVAQILQNPLEQGGEVLRGKGLIDAAPIHEVVGDRVVHNELVFGTASGARAGGRHDGAIGGEPRLAAQQSGLDQLRHWQIQVRLPSGRQGLKHVHRRKNCHEQNSFRAKR